MEGTGPNRNTLILSSIGLVIVGLLSGIFLMLWIQGRPHQGEVGPSIVERVQLGSTEPLQRAAVPASGPATVAGALSLERLFREAAKHVTPAVVYIQVETGGSSMVPRGWFHRHESDEVDPYHDQGPRQSVGSGVIINPQGYIITNNHVVENASSVLVTLTDKRQFEAHIVGTDHATDLAVLKIKGASKLPSIHFGNSDSVRVGDWALAVGNPFRLTSTVTAGIISALGRQVNIINDDFSVEDFIQTDAAINPGNSGGALVNLNGELIGISTAIATESGSYEGYGFAVPVNLMRRVAEDLIAYGEVKRGFLGVEIGEVHSEEARRLGLKAPGGVYLQKVWRNGAAARAGLRTGDVVVAIDNQPVYAVSELQRTIALHRPGDKLGVKIWRQGERRRVEVELLGRDDPSYASWFNQLSRDEPPRMPDLTPDEPKAQGFEASAWGISIENVPGRDRSVFGIDSGAYITHVARGSVSSLAGLPSDVIISRIEDQSISSADQAVQSLSEAIEQGNPLLIGVRRRDGTMAFYEVDVPGTR
ncbi:MAG TPA: trypsin-like peptidase domain-containing protein [Rhodothermales bacterium]|nr:trypsin-like peptidase domain-containing protein [Rhodothermales bacterium]